MRFFKVEEIDEDTFIKQAGSYESIFVSGSQRGKDGAVYVFVDGRVWDIFGRVWGGIKNVKN